MPARGRNRSQEYPIGAPPATPSLEGILRGKIHAAGPLAFPDYLMDHLYHPKLGYYANAVRKIGRDGDFFTSVSVGPLFGELLARRFLRHFRESGSPSRWRLIECGAHDGSLAADVLGALRRLDATAFSRLEYVIAEPLAALKRAQQDRLAEFSEIVAFPDSLADAARAPLPGAAFGNELLDALPFHVVERREGRWLECRVGIGSGDELAWQTAEMEDPRLAAELEKIGGDFPDGYRTELRTCYGDFLAPLASALDQGLMIWPDYGFARADYYHPDRRAGTLRTFLDHRAGEDPFVSPGGCDVTAHVDFTAVAEAAIALGARVLEFERQGTWLTSLAREWLMAQEGRPDAAALRQFQTLTHPAHLGGAFQVIELSWRPGTVADAETAARRLWG